MTMKIKALFLLLACLSILPGVARAQPAACPYRQSILTLSDRLLADLDSKAPGISRFYGRDAAYLKLHYGKMQAAEIDGMLNRLMEKGAAGAADFTYAYYIAEYGYEPAGKRMGKRLADIRSRPFDLTLMRALGKAGRLDVVLDNLRNTQDTARLRGFAPLALPFIDDPPDIRLLLAARAEQARLPLLAGELYASLPTYDEWPGFLKRNYQDIGYGNSRGVFMAFSAYNFTNPPLPDPRNRVNGLMHRQLIQNILAASWLLPQSALLHQFSAQFRFKPVYGNRAALKLKAAYDRGLLRPDGPVEKGWLLVYRALAEASGDPQLIVSEMQQVRIASRHSLQPSAGDILDAMLATEAIGPWLTGETKLFPDVPALASAKLRANWPEWTSLAQAVKSGKNPENPDPGPVRRGMATELLYAKGDQPGLLRLIAAENNPAFRQRLTSDFMARFDRLCDASLYFPGEALFLRNATIHRFDRPAK